jgi:hypothetical protein
MTLVSRQFARERTLSKDLRFIPLLAVHFLRHAAALVLHDLTEQ